MTEENKKQFFEEGSDNKKLNKNEESKIVIPAKMIIRSKLGKPMKNSVDEEKK